MSAERQAFAPYHRWDRNFFLAFIILCWFGVIAGFAPSSIGRMAGKADYPAPLVLHIHALAFACWLTLLTMQVALVRRNNLSVHKRLGLTSLVLIPVMSVTAVAAEMHSQRFYLDNPPDSQAFFIVPLFYIAAFTPLAIAAIVARRDPPAHKRLIMLATTIIVGAAYTRWWGVPLTNLVGDGFFGMLINTFTATNTIILTAMGYDLATRGRLHPVYWIAVPIIFAGEFVTSYTYHSPDWPPFARILVGR